MNVDSKIDLKYLASRQTYMYSVFLLAMSEALDRLLIARFCGETKENIPDHLISISADPDSFDSDYLDQVSKFAVKFEDFKARVRSGEFGKTKQFWMTYLDLIRVQHYVHTAVQENNFQLPVLAMNRVWSHAHALAHTHKAKLMCGQSHT